MLNANYHTHTFRCGHADGIDEDYVKQALGMGLAVLGFSDHAMYPGYSEPGIRADFLSFHGYVDSINALKKKYMDRMKIYIGFEAEGYLPYLPYLKELLATHTLDYLLLGNHSAMNEKHQVYAKFGKATNANNLYLYGQTCCEAMKTGLYSCLVHPDLFLSEVPYFDSDCRKVSKDIIRTALECKIPLEINCGGIRSGKRKIGDEYRYTYPTYAFFSLVAKMKAPCIIGIDAHSPTQLSDPDANAIAVRFARELGLQVIDRLPFKKVSA